jgi:hypothetical protein
MGGGSTRHPLWVRILVRYVSNASSDGVPVTKSHSSANSPSVNPDEIVEPPAFAATREERHKAIIASEENGGAGGEASNGIFLLS